MLPSIGRVQMMEMSCSVTVASPTEKWKVFGPSDAVEFVHKLLKEGLPVTAVSRRLVREAVRERRCKDNCTAIVIVFRQQ
ncbi:putative protein phosphatase 2C 8 [Sesamum angolense]|uniref:PPM-type phosphatase domain-containing protein n=1 Tax=Sesamum angolense TaxID=2727404 RepID=A0AAE2C5A8_9LAMI|nr:putative protein phosphatase 2C 8 [Sesamum angolense]